MLKRLEIYFAAIIVAGIAVSTQCAALTTDAPERKPGTVVGTVMDVNGDTVAGATVVLETLDANNGRPIVTSDSGYFSFVEVNPGVPYQKITAPEVDGVFNPEQVTQLIGILDEIRARAAA